MSMFTKSNFIKSFSLVLIVCDVGGNTKMFAKYVTVIISKWTFHNCLLTTKPVYRRFNSFSKILNATSETTYQLYAIRSRTVYGVDVFVITFSQIIPMG